MKKTFDSANRVRRIGWYKRVRLREYERGILWMDGEVKQLLRPGVHWFSDPFGRARIDVHDMRLPWLPAEGLDLIIRSGVLASEAEVLELNDNQRALVWLDDRFDRILGPGTYAWWKGMARLEVEKVDITDHDGALVLAKQRTVAATADVLQYLHVVNVPAESVGIYFRDGVLVRTIGPGRHGFWKGADEKVFKVVDTREQMFDIAGQDLLTADKLTVRVNAVLSFRIIDAEKSLLSAVDARQSIYREAQLALRAEVGERDLDRLMAEKEALAREMEKIVRAKAVAYGLDVVSFGVRDIILPGDIRELLLKTTEAKKASEAATIVRREETAAMRHQLNTARLLAENPVLMRLRELETVEKVAAGGKLKVVLGDNGLADKVVKLV